MHGTPTRHPHRAGGLLLAALAALAATPAIAADVTTPIVSGLAFRSGASYGTDCLAQLRNRPLDVVLSFLGHKSFPALPGYAAAMARTAKKAPLWVVTVPLLTDDTRGQFAQCAAGSCGQDSPRYCRRAAIIRSFCVTLRLLPFDSSKHRSRSFSKRLWGI